MSLKRDELKYFDLLTLDEAKNWLRIDGDDMDLNIEMAIAAASAACWAYLKTSPLWSGTDATPANVKMAAALLTGVLIRDPDGAESQTWEPGFLPWGVTNLLYPYRDPALS